MKDSVLETSLVVEYMTKISPQNFWNLTAKLAPKLRLAENWKS
jgi:hypothetical protein